jgi:general secretion pathway protein D
MKTTARFILVAGAVLLGLAAGCAPLGSYREGRVLADRGELEEALPKIEEAVRAEPRNAEYRATYLRVRERLSQQLNAQALRQADQGAMDEAQRLFQRVLAVDPANTRAREGLAAIERDRRHSALLKEAEHAQGKGDLETTALRLRQILAENPGHAGARALQRSLAEAAVRPSTPVQIGPALRKPVTIEFKDAPLRQIFEVLARTSGLNFVFDRDVRSDTRTSVFLRNSTVEAVIHLVLLTNQLEQRIVDQSTIVIYPNTPAKVREYQQLVVRGFLLSTADAKVVAQTIRTIGRSRDVVVDEKLNMIIVRDSPEAVRLAERLVALHDAPEPEVMLDVEVLEVKRSRLLELGVRWPGQLSLTPLPRASGGVLSLDDLRHLNSGTLGATLDPVTIQANQEDSDTNLLANPRIRARNREKARILIGDRVPTITSTSTATGFVSESVTYIDVGLKLDVEPTVYLDGDVAIKIALEVSNIVSQVQTRSGTLAYQLGTRSATTTLRLKDGENQVLAGLIQDDQRGSSNRVPLLGDVPLLGRLFGVKSDNDAKTEIVLSITPRLIRNIQRPDASIAEFDAGTEASLRGRGFETAAPAPQAPRTDAAPSQPAPPPAAPPGGATPASGTSPPAPIATLPPATVPVTTGPGGAQVLPQLTWQGPVSVAAGEKFVAQLFMQSGQPIVSLPLTVEYDAKMLEVVGAAEGDFLRQGGAQTSFTSRAVSPGQFAATITRTAASGGATALAPALVLTFRALAAADTTAVRVGSVAPVGLDGRAIVVQAVAPLILRITP